MAAASGRRGSPTSAVTPARYVAALRAEGTALADAAAGALDRPVPSCPDWTLADLVRHTGDVHRHKLALLAAGGTQPPGKLHWPAAPPGGRALLTWYREGLALLADVLERSEPEQPAYSWAGDHRVAFWQRRMCQETLVHRWDAEAAAGTPGPLDPELAADGIDEFLHLWLPRGRPFAAPGGTVHVHRSDGHGEWLVDLTARPPAVERGHARAATALRGTAEDLLLVLWRRRPVAAVEVLGDRALAEAFVAHADLD